MSAFRTASTKYQFNPMLPSVAGVSGEKELKIDYILPYPGKVLPDSPLWPLKALRDKLWLFVNADPTREAELSLLFADKRLGSAKILFDNGKAEVGVSTLTKAEKYLEEASALEKKNRKNGIDTTDFLTKMANASLKHFELIEYVLSKAPDDARPSILQTQVYPKNIYENARNGLLEKGKIPPENPFSW